MQLPSNTPHAVAVVVCFIAAALVSRFAGTSCLFGVCLEIAEKTT